MSEDTWLPKGYKEPVQDNYMKFKEGDNRFRILSKPIVGWEYWKTEVNDDGKEVKKPVRHQEQEGIPIADVPYNQQGNLELKHFWAFVVYNYQAEKIQILEITQASIRDVVGSYTRRSKWGDPTEYDIVVTRTGEGFDTKYSTTADPKEKIDPKIVERYEDMKINLGALFKNEDPFANPDKKEAVLDVNELDKAIPGGKGE